MVPIIFATIGTFFSSHSSPWIYDETIEHQVQVRRFIPEGWQEMGPGEQTADLVFGDPTYVRFVRSKARYGSVFVYRHSQRKRTSQLVFEGCYVVWFKIVKDKSAKKGLLLFRADGDTEELACLVSPSWELTTIRTAGDFVLSSMWPLRLLETWDISKAVNWRKVPAKWQNKYAEAARTWTLNASGRALIAGRWQGIK